MNFITSEAAMEQPEWDQQIDAMSIYRAFEHIEDGRAKRGVRYPLALILTFIVLGKLVGMSSLAAIADWVRLTSKLAESGASLHVQRLSLCCHLQ